MGEKFTSGSSVMASLRRRFLLLLASRNKVRSLSHSPALLLVIALLLTGVCVFTFSRNDQPVIEAVREEVTVFETPAQSLVVEKEKYQEIESVGFTNSALEIKSDTKVRNVFHPPLPVVFKKEIRQKNQRSDLKDFEVDGNGANSPLVFGNVEISVNAEPNSAMGKVLGFAEKVQQMNDEGPSFFNSVMKVAKGFKYVSDKVASVDKKIQNKKLKQVQGFVNSQEMLSIDEGENIVPNVPLGPEARKNSGFEKTMQHEDQRPSLMKTIAKRIGPALLSGIEESAVNEDAMDAGAGGHTGPSFLENLFINIGPKIIEEALGGGNAGEQYDDAGGLSKGGFGNALKFLGPLVKKVVLSQQGDKGDVNTAVSSLMGVIGGLAPFLQGGSNSKRSLGETLKSLQPVLNFMAPSILEKIIDSKNHAQTRKERSSRDPAVDAGSVDDVPVKEQGTIIDKMLHGMDEKTVGQAVGRALSSVVVGVMPDTVHLPKPTAIRSPYDMALNLVLGNPRNNSKSVWTWLRKVSGESEPGTTMPSKWIRDALSSPKRSTFKEDVRHLFGLLQNVEQACRDLVEVGGIYDWKKDNILGSRTVCEDFDLWKSLTQRVVLSFGLRDGWSFEEEIARRPNCQIYAVDPALGMPNHNHSENIAFYKGGLAVEKGLSQMHGDVQEMLPYSLWLERWNLTRTQLQYVKVDLGGGEWQVLQSMIDDNSRPLEDILQLSVNVHLDDALRDPSLYATHIKTLDTLTGLGFQLLSATAAPGGTIYEEPLLDNRKLPLQYKLTYVRI